MACKTKWELIAMYLMKMSLTPARMLDSYNNIKLITEFFDSPSFLQSLNWFREIRYELFNMINDER